MYRLFGGLVLTERSDYWNGEAATIAVVVGYHSPLNFDGPSNRIVPAGVIGADKGGRLEIIGSSNNSILLEIPITNKTLTACKNPSNTSTIIKSQFIFSFLFHNNIKLSTLN